MSGRRLRRPRLPRRFDRRRASTSPRTRTASSSFPRPTSAHTPGPRRSRRSAAHPGAARSACGAGRTSSTCGSGRARPDGTLHPAEAGQRVDAGQPCTIADAAASRFEAYDSLAKVYGLYQTFNHDPQLAEFASPDTWPKLKPEEKQALYSKYACHELHLFLARRTEFFEAVVVSPRWSRKVPGQDFS